MSLIGAVTVVAAATMVGRAGIGHWLRPDEFNRTLANQRIWSDRRRTVIVTTLPAAETAIGVGALLAAASGIGQVPAGLALGALALMFGGLIATLLVQGSDAPCGCGWGDEPVHRVALLRPVLLLAAAIVLISGSTTTAMQGLAGADIAVAFLAGASMALLLDLAVSTASVPRAVSVP